MKNLTIYQWLSLLPAPIRNKALRNARKRGKGSFMCAVSVRTETLGEAIQSAFVWEHTPEGYGYWENWRTGHYYLLLKTV